MVDIRLCAILLVVLCPVSSTRGVYLENGLKPLLIVERQKLSPDFSREAADLTELTVFATKLNSSPLHIPEQCNLTLFGLGFGEHYLCGNLFPRAGRCRFISVGISNDWSFDTALSSLSCSGLALDPTVNLPTILVPGVLFLKLGAYSHNHSGNIRFDTISMPRLRKWYGHPLSILKMDCEGCEYALAETIERDDPNFFRHVSQFSVELHLPSYFMRSDDDVYRLGRLLRLIRQSGLRFVHHDI